MGTCTRPCAMLEFAMPVFAATAVWRSRAFRPGGRWPPAARVAAGQWPSNGLRVGDANVVTAGLAPTAAGPLHTPRVRCPAAQSAVNPVKSLLQQPHGPASHAPIFEPPRRPRVSPFLARWWQVLWWRPSPPSSSPSSISDPPKRAPMRCTPWTAHRWPCGNSIFSMWLSGMQRPASVATC